MTATIGLLLPARDMSSICSTTRRRVPPARGPPVFYLRAARTPSGSSSRRSPRATRTPTSTSSRRAARPSPRSGTLGVGANGGGQTIVQLTEDGEVDAEFVSAHPSATCLSDPSAALGLQHDVEATPKGGTILNTDEPLRRPARDAQLLIDATDAAGRCHDQGVARPRAARRRAGSRSSTSPNPADPVEIGLTSHIGEAHTVNVDPKRPHIAYSVTSDTRHASTTTATRDNEDPAELASASTSTASRSSTCPRA